MDRTEPLIPADQPYVAGARLLHHTIGVALLLVTMVSALVWSSVGLRLAVSRYDAAVHGITAANRAGLILLWFFLTGLGVVLAGSGHLVGRRLGRTGVQAMALGQLGALAGAVLVFREFAPA